MILCLGMTLKQNSITVSKEGVGVDIKQTTKSVFPIESY